MTSESALRVISSENDGIGIADLMGSLGRRARAGARAIALAPAHQRDAALIAMAQALRARAATILAANARDLAEAKAAGQNAAFIDRLMLDEKRLSEVAQAVADIAKLPDPVGRVLAE